MEGYISRYRPDVGWWKLQLRAGEIFRDRLVHRTRWPAWRDYYRGNWKQGTMPKNLFFTMLRTVVPRIYFRNPSFSIQPARPGPLHMALAKILERVTNKLVIQMEMKKHAKRLVQNTYMFGTGFPTTGIGTLYHPAPGLGEIDSPTDRSGNKLEFGGPSSRQPWFGQVHAGNFIVPAGTQYLDTCPWTAEVVVRAMDDVTRDPRFKNVNDLKQTGDRSYFRVSSEELPHGKLHTSQETIKLYMVSDRRTGLSFVLAPERTNKVILGPIEDIILQERGYKHHDLIFNEDDEFMWGIPDSRILEPFQIAINEIKTKQMWHRRLSMVKLMYDKNKMGIDDVMKMVTQDVLPAVPVDGSPRDAILPLDIKIPSALLIDEQEMMQDVRESLGFSRNQFGEYKPGSSDTTATEAQIVQQASEIRVDERRDMTADVLVSAIKDIHHLIFTYWTQEDVVDIVGPEGLPVWVKFTGPMLKYGSYELKVDPDSSVPDTKQVREQRSERMYAFLAQNPLIDPLKLTTYLLHEHHGVIFDDMIRSLPILQQGQWNNPIELTQLLTMMDQRRQQGLPDLSQVKLLPDGFNAPGGA